MSNRKIHLPSGIWRYQIGTSYVIIYSPNGLKYTANAADVAETTSDLLARGRRKKTSDGMITPADVKRYIETKTIGV